MADIDSDIRTRVESFVDDLTELIRASALDAVQEALAGPGAATPRRGRKKRATKKKAAKRKAGKRVRRTSEQVERLGASILAHLKKNPGQRLGEIAKALGVETKDARRPAFALVEAGKLKTTGQRGGTRYFSKGAAAPKKKVTRKKRKKTTKKRAASKRGKTAKRKTSKKAA